MSHVDWKLKTRRLATCSCDYGCPCEFSATPTRVPCEGVEAFEIVDGHFDERFEFREAEMASSTFRSSGAIEQSHTGCYGFVTLVTYHPYGIVEEESYPQIMA